jgi:hypothetical protein
MAITQTPPAGVATAAGEDAGDLWPLDTSTFGTNPTTRSAPEGFVWVANSGQPLLSPPEVPACN